MGEVPAIRIRSANSAHVAHDRLYVLYWMIATRRSTWNFAFDRAVHWAQQLGKPLLVFEPLHCDYRWASDRLHRFIIEGMRDNQTRLDRTPVAYYPYVEPTKGAGHGLLEALATLSCVVVTDDFPCFFLPKMVAAAADRLDVALEAVDSNGILPLAATDKVFTTAFSFRRFLQKNLPEHLDTLPTTSPLDGIPLPDATIPERIVRRWPPTDFAQLLDDPTGLANLPIDHTVGPAAFAGGANAAVARWQRFLDDRFDRYLEERNVPDADATSGLSPYLHFGHISAHQLLHTLLDREHWNTDSLSDKPTGSREGWWGTSKAAEAFLDQFITWRELGFNRCAHADAYDTYESLPDWARATLDKHAVDPREHAYALEEFAAGATHDRLWNAAQNQLRSEGRLHNYLRMLWGKKILQWSATPTDALETMIALNDRYAVDGRDPNSYSGICWVLGRYDRAWGPERPIFGKVRYMTSENTARKVAVKKYLERYAPQP